MTHTEPLHIPVGQTVTTKPRVSSPWNHFFTVVIESFMPKIENNFHIWHHSLPILGEYKSTRALTHSEPLHILIGQSITTKPRTRTRTNTITRRRRTRTQEEQEQEERTRPRRTTIERRTGKDKKNNDNKKKKKNIRRARRRDKD